MACRVHVGIPSVQVAMDLEASRICGLEILSPTGLPVWSRRIKSDTLMRPKCTPKLVDGNGCQSGTRIHFSGSRILTGFVALTDWSKNSLHVPGLEERYDRSSPRYTRYD